MRHTGSAIVRTAVAAITAGLTTTCYVVFAHAQEVMRHEGSAR
jgi:hypothetical protein